MTFKPHRDSRPLNERSVAVQMEAVFHQSIKHLLTKKQQGKVMGAFREVLTQFRSEQVPLPLSQGQELMQTGLLAIVDTARKAYNEGYFEGHSKEDWEAPEPEIEWIESDACAACIKAVEHFTGRKL